MSEEVINPKRNVENVITPDLLEQMQKNQGTDVELAVSLQTVFPLHERNQTLLKNLGFRHTTDVEELEWSFWLGRVAIADIVLLKNFSWVLHMQVPHFGEIASHIEKEKNNA